MKKYLIFRFSAAVFACFFGCFLIFLLSDAYYSLNPLYSDDISNAEIYVGSFISPDTHSVTSDELEIIKAWSDTLEYSGFYSFAIMGEGPNLKLSGRFSSMSLKLRNEAGSDILAWGKGIFTARSTDAELSKKVYDIVKKYSDIG